jgi:lysozyme
MSYVPGIDVSIWEPRIDWLKVRLQGYRFALIKASEGNFKDPCFDAHWEGSRKAGLIRGAYHYLKVAQDAKAQAQFYLNAVKFAAGDLAPILDLEEIGNQGQPNARFIANVEIWLKQVEQATGKKAFVYSRASFLQSKVTLPNGKAPAWAADYPVWIAHYFYNYVEGIKPWEFAGWQPWTFWQYTDRGQVGGVTNVDGIPTNVDLNWFKGTVADLYKLAGAKMPEALLHEIQSGDTLAAIAAKYQLSVADLLTANPQLIQPGMKLTIPLPPVTAPEVVSEVSAPEHVATSGATEPSSGYTLYIVQKWDNLFSIAKRFETTIDEIVALNKLPNADLIYEGQELKIPRKKVLGIF